ncbi:MAG: formate-dependent phosphoribosylglycinamide formyltransferase (GAR transformylase) [Polaribacter sp.]
MQATSKPGHKPGFVLLIAPANSYRISPYLKAALALNLKTLLVSNSRYSLVPEVAHGVTVDFTDQVQALSIILESIEDLDIKCVLATDDSCVSLSNQIAWQLGLTHNQSSATLLTHRKDLARDAAQSFGCNTPEYQVVELQQSNQCSKSVNYPVVIKPLSLSASKGVIRANNQQQFKAACATIDIILAKSNFTGYERNHVLVEGYLDGPEFAVDGILIDGIFHLLAIFDKPEPLTGPYFEETYYLTPSQLSQTNQSALIAEVSRCCDAYGLTQGPIHAEARITENGVFLIELAARTIGGQCGQLIEFSLQQKLEEIVIQGLCGKTPNLPKKSLCAGVLMIPVKTSGILKRVEGLTAAMQVEFVKDIEIHIQEGYELVPLPEGSSYLGFMFAQAPSFEQTFDALKKAHQMLNFVTQPIWRLDRADPIARL